MPTYASPRARTRSRPGSRRRRRRRRWLRSAGCSRGRTASSTCAGAASPCWIPLGDFDLGLPFENHTSFPAPGEILLYPGGFCETEILFPYGGVRFASIVGQLAGNHFLTIEEGRENLRELGVMTLYEGAQEIVFEAL